MSGWEGLLSSLSGASENFGNSKFGKGLLNLLQDPTTGDFANGLLAQGGDFAGTVGRSLIDAEKMKLLRMESEAKKEAEERKRKQSEALMAFLGGGSIPGMSEVGGTKEDQERKQRAAMALALGDYDAAVKILTEKPSERGPNKPTTSTLTQNQSVIQGADNIVPIIDNLLKGNIPNQITGQYTSPNVNADYEADVITIAEGLMAVRNLPQTEATLNKMMKVAGRQPLESEAAYKKRLIKLKEEILNRKKKALKITSVGGGSEASLSDEDLEAIANE